MKRYLNIFLFLFISLSSFINAFRINELVYYIILFSTYAGWFLTLDLKEEMLLRAHKINVINLFIMLYIYSYLISLGKIQLMKYYFDFLQMLFFAIAYNYYKDRNNDSVIISQIIIAIMLLNLIFTARELILSPYSARSLKYNLDETTKELALRGVGTYTLIYPSIFLLLSIIGLKKIMFKKLIMLILFCTIIISGYSYAIILTILGIYCYFVMSSFKRKRYLLFIILIGIPFFLYMYIVPLLNYMKDMKIFAAQKGKIDSLLFILHTGNMLGQVQFEARAERYLRSINAFRKNPIFGSIVSESYIYGLHSTILDSFALNGVIGGIGIILFLFNGIIYRIRNESQDRVIDVTIFIIYFLLSIINLITPSIYLIIYFVIPSIYSYYSNNHNYKSNR